MHVLVSDTSIFIDLERCALLRDAFALPVEFVVPDLLYERELRDHGGPDLIDEEIESVTFQPVFRPITSLRENPVPQREEELEAVESS